MRNRNHFHLDNLDYTVSNILFAAKRELPPKYKYEQAGRTNHGIALITGGKALYSIDGHRSAAGKNDLVFFRKGSSYLRMGDKASPLQHIVISFDLLKDQALPWDPLPYVYRPDNAEYLKNNFIRLYKTWSLEEIGYKVKCKTILQDIILDIIIENSQGQKDDFLRIQPALEYMNLNFDKQISIGELSRIVNLSQTYFRKLFKQAYGLSPIEYLNNIRINKAKRMLCHGRDPIGEISRKTGFCDIFYFSRTFKNKVGMSPKDFRKQTL